MVRNSLLYGLSQPVKRKTFFSFYYGDIMRVNNVRNAFKLYNPATLLAPTFYDSSLWESRKLEGDESIKRLIREGIGNTSVVCVLVGSETWSRPWVKYEIARSVIDGKGLMALHINNIKHHQRGVSDSLGQNPLAHMGVCRMLDGSLKLYENSPGGWIPYQGYTHSVKLPSYLQEPRVGYVQPLSSGTKLYDFINDNGHANIGLWINNAAVDAGR